MQTAVKTTPVRRIEPAISRETNDARPTETRYGWCPFQNINLVGPDGTINMYVQPHEIAGFDGVPEANPYHRLLPKGQLIPFPTFNAIIWGLSEDLKDSKGAAMPVQTTRSSTALENIVSVLRVYSGWGFSVLSSLQGLDQDIAGRIFQIVQPFDYLLKDLEGELEFGAIERIASTQDIRFDLPDGEIYHVTALFTDEERSIAYALASEMLAGASIAVQYASSIFDETIVSINNRLAGGQGKAGPDPLDRFVAEQLGRTQEIPSVASRNNGGGATTSANETLEKKLDYLIDDARARADKDRIEALEEELRKYKAGQGVADFETSDEGQKEATVEYGTCGYVRPDGTACKRKTPLGEKCGDHAEMTAEV